MTSTNGRTPDALLGSPAVGARDGALRADGHLVNRIPVAVAVVAAALGCVVLSGWVFGVSVLKNGVPGLVEMKANTAVCFLLVAAAVWLLRRPRRAP